LAAALRTTGEGEGEARFVLYIVSVRSSNRKALFVCRSLPNAGYRGEDVSPGLENPLLDKGK
jgi:hypothetical protein